MNPQSTPEQPMRPRRLRRTAALRALTSETQVHARDLVLPMFVREGLTEPKLITSMPGVVQRAGNLFSVAFGEFTGDSATSSAASSAASSAPARRPAGASDAPDGSVGPRNYAQAQAQESWRYPAFFHSMLDSGVALPPSVFEAWFVTAAHDDAVVDQVLAALPAAARAAAQATPPTN